MKLRKIESILLAVGFGALLLGAVLFMVIPLLVTSGFDYSGIKALVEGIKSIVSFDFNNTVYTLLFVVLVVTIIVGAAWATVIGVKKRRIHAVAMSFTLLGTIIIEFFLMAYLVAKVRFNGAEGQLFGSIMNLEGNLLGKLLSMLVLGFLYVSLMFLTLYGFIDIATMVLGEQVQEGFTQIIKERIIQGLPESPIEGYEDRKAREEAFFKACIETGEFTQYDEIDLGAPLEGYTEEPVFESAEVEEETKIIKREVCVKVTTKQTIQVK